MDIQKIEKLITLVEKSKISELEIKEKDGETFIKITGKKEMQSSQVNYVPTEDPSTLTSSVTRGSSSMQEIKSPTDVQKTMENNQAKIDFLKSPMVGTFYQAAAPGAAPFIKEGQKVTKGQTLCIIEAMKIMNQIEAEKTGTVKKILVEDGASVEFDQALFEISQ